MNPVYNRNGNQVTASLAVKYLDNQTMTTQVSQFNLVLEKNGENWKIVKIVIKNVHFSFEICTFLYKIFLLKFIISLYIFLISSQ